VNDARDDALAAVLDDSVRGIDPSPDERLTAIRRRGSARRAVRWVAVVTALAVSLGAVAWAGLALRKEAPTPSATSTGPAPGDWRTDQDERLGLSFRHPESWPIVIVDTTCRVTFQGVLVTSDPPAIPHGFVQRDECGPSFIGAWVPGDAVIVAITRWEGGPSPLPSEGPDTPFPLSIDDAKPELGFWPPSLSALEAFGVMTVAVQVGGDDRYAVRLFIAPEASEEDVAIAERVISSIGLIDPCATARDLIIGLHSCEEAMQELPIQNRRILSARYDASGERPIWVFVTEPYRFFAANPRHPSPVCYEGAEEILLDARTGEFVEANGLGGHTPCTSP
jgi:hypothetical protein